MLPSYHSRTYTCANDPAAYTLPQAPVLSSPRWFVGISLQPSPPFPPPHYRLPPFPVLEILRWDPLQDRGAISGKQPNGCCPHNWATGHVQSHNPQGHTLNIPGIYIYTEQKYRNAPQSPHEVVHYLKVFLIYEVTLLVSVLGSCTH